MSSINKQNIFLVNIMHKATKSDLYVVDKKFMPVIMDMNILFIEKKILCSFASDI